MSNKVLMLASVASMIQQFNMANIRILKDMGYTVHVACNFVEGNTCSDEQVDKLKHELTELEVEYFQIDFKRNVWDIFGNMTAYKQVYRLMRDNMYRFVHCHSPIGGLFGRLAGKATNTRVIYTAHGFHFCKGAPLRNWLLYYPVERYLSRFTDVLITINKEDYSRAKKYFRAGRIEYIPGVGLDIGKFRDVVIDRAAKRKEIGVPEDAFVLVSVGELNRNKNHEVIVKALAKLKNKRIYYVICGSGPLEKYLKNLITELCLGRHVKLLGYRADIPDILKAADVFAFPSKREGLGLAALEAMASGLPIITSNVHGIVDYSISGITGFTCKPTDIQGFANAIDVLLKDESLRFRMGAHNQEVVQRFELKKALLLMKKIYRKELLQ